MTWVGAKTCFTIVLFVGAVIAAALGGLLSLDYLLPLGHWATFLAALLGVIAGTAAYRAWRVGESSASYIAVIARKVRWGTEEELEEICLDELVVGTPKLYELPPLAHHVAYMTVALLAFLVPLDNRAMAQLEKAQADKGEDWRGYCPPTEEMTGEQAEEAEDKKKDIPVGCELVYRAYRLGYAKDLGDCAEDDDEEEEEVCLLRQRDEPYMHYMWRLLWKSGESDAEGPEAVGVSERLAAQWNAAGSLANELYAATAGAPRASHHVFTNLPEPDDEVSGVGCLDRFYDMPYVIEVDFDGEAPESQALVHVLGQLLFNPAYPPVVGTCREFQVHWESPRDACDQLVKRGEDFLDDVGIDDDVAAILDRHQRMAEIRELPDASSPRELPEPTAITSFQCLMVEPGVSTEPTEGAFTFRDIELPVRTMTIPEIGVQPNGQMNLAKALGRLMAPGFGYVRIDSEQAALVDESDGKLQALLSDSSFMFSKLELLRDSDLFLGHEWLAQRGDLLEIYPYHIHLINFVERFREHYQTKRGRL